jgi:hypothetical protein
MINIAVCCREQAQFDSFVSDTNLVASNSGIRALRIGGITFTRVTTSLDIQGCTFDGVIRLSELNPAVEDELIAALRPAIPL